MPAEGRLPAAKLPRKVDIIWNHTRICGFNCKVCCVAANHAVGSKLFSADLGSAKPLVRLPGENKFAAAQRDVQASGEELSFDRKLRVLENLKGFDAKVDVSGGDALITPDGLPLLEACARKLGRSNVTLTITGAGIGENPVAHVANLIAEFNFTYNAASPKDADTRPSGYADGNLRLAREMKKLGIPARAECPLTKDSSQPEHLERLYANLADEQIDKLLIMRQFPVGRGELFPEHVPTREQYIQAIVTLRRLEAHKRGPKVKLQCALRHLEALAGLSAPSGENPCDLGLVSYGLMADGTLLASPWAMNSTGRPLGDSWVLGNLADNTLIDLLSSPKAQRFIAGANENHGHCKIFAGLNSPRPDPFDRIFDRTDPLYVGTDEAFRLAAE